MDEYADFKRGERLAAASLMGGQALADATVSAFLASPQAAEELAWALGSESARRFVAEAWVEAGVSEPGYATPNEMAAAILAAWQKVRHPEEGS